MSRALRVFLERLALFLAGFGLLWAWAALLPALPCLVLPVGVALAAVTVTSGMLEAARMRRMVWREQYLNSGGRLYRWVKPGAVLHGMQLLPGMVLAFYLLVQSLFWNPLMWAVLAMDALAFAVLLGWLERRLHDEVKPGFLERVAHHFALRINVAFLAVAIVVVALYSTQMDYRGETSDRVLDTVAAAPAFECDAAGVVYRGALYAQEMLYWGMQNAVGNHSSGGPIALLAWLLVLVAGTTYAWAFTRWIAGLDRLSVGARWRRAIQGGPPNRGT